MNFCVRLPVTGAMASSEAIELFAKTAESQGYYAVTTHDHVYINYEKRYHTKNILMDRFPAKGYRSALVFKLERNSRFDARYVNWHAIDYPWLVFELESSLDRYPVEDA